MSDEATKPPLTDAELDAHEALLGRATPGPWEAGRAWINAPRECWIQHDDGSVSNTLAWMGLLNGENREQETAKLIAALVNDAPRFIAAAREVNRMRDLSFDGAECYTVGDVRAVLDKVQAERVAMAAEVADVTARCKATEAELAETAKALREARSAGLLAVETIRVMREQAEERERKIAQHNVWHAENQADAARLAAEVERVKGRLERATNFSWRGGAVWAVMPEDSTLWHVYEERGSCGAALVGKYPTLDAAWSAAEAHAAAQGTDREGAPS